MALFSKVLIANRGVAAVRLARTLQRLGIVAVGLRTSSERYANYFERFDEVVDLQGNDLTETYLDGEQIVRQALAVGAQAIHPGYGFLSENAVFARQVADAGLVFIGPQPEVIEAFGLKHRARELAEAEGVQMLPGSSLLTDPQDAVVFADTIGYPVIVKSTAGGGGIGMLRCDDRETLIEGFARVEALAQSAFATPGVFVEKFLTAPRHVEVQIFGDGLGGVVALGDRDCSLQRRHQKLVEECPAPNIPESIRSSLHQQAKALVSASRYASAGTVEFLYDPAAGEFYFLEVNTRLQVEHGVTEEVFSVDLVEWMVSHAAGALPPIAELESDLKGEGSAIQIRLYAEDPYADFRPQPGLVTIDFPDESRVDTWIEGSEEVSHQFDPMLANIICHRSERIDSLAALRQALRSTSVSGQATNLSYLLQAIGTSRFADAQLSTHALEDMVYEPTELEVVRSGLSTTVQSLPGRQGYWSVGVPPSGPMDDLSFRLGNALLGNPVDAPGLEITFEGPTILFRHAARIVITGGEVAATVNGKPLVSGRVTELAAGDLVEVGRIEEGLRCYLLIGGGLDVPEVLGSTATFSLGQMGGHQGRALRVGDILRWSACDESVTETFDVSQVELSQRHRIRVLLGPHTAPDFFTETSLQELLDAEWTVHHNSSRTGVRLIGPRPMWARDDGGEAGLHPSNLHDNAYAFGALDFTGDMPVILGPDGPSLGGFVCPAVVINADRWKLGQLQPGDSLRFAVVDEASANALEQAQLQSLTVQPTRTQPLKVHSPVLYENNVNNDELKLVVRRAGQDWLLIEFGPPRLDIRIRARVQILLELLQEHPISGIVEMTPGVRSLQVRFDSSLWRADRLIETLQSYLADAAGSSVGELKSRIVHMPLSWNDPACQLAVERYVSSVRADAPWCPDNIEFIRRINGLADAAEVKRIVYDASYLVMGLGDVYLGAPVATPLDPRHRLVTTKYNPARTWTAENSVGIGGSYMCIYGMEGPGGYQFVGRTTPIWRTSGYRQNGRSWLLDHFDQVRYFEVDSETLLDMREAARHGRYYPQIEETTLDLEALSSKLRTQQDSIDDFVSAREAAFKEEMSAWREAGLDTFFDEQVNQPKVGTSMATGQAVECPMAGSVWRVKSVDGAAVEAQAVLLVLEAMKSEIEILAPTSGTLELCVREGEVVGPGQTLALIH